MKSGLSKARLARLGSALAQSVEQGEVPGVVALIHRHGETHVEVHGTLAFGGKEKMRRDTIFRVASITKPIVPRRQ